jgi:hypothetical protein
VDVFQTSKKLIQEKLKRVVSKWLTSALGEYLMFDDTQYVNMSQTLNQNFKFLHKLGSDKWLLPTKGMLRF